MSEQNYVGIKPKHCNECGEDYTPIIYSDECPHNKVGVSKQDGLLTPEETRKTSPAGSWYAGCVQCAERVAEAQRAKQHNRFKKALEQSRKGEPLDLDEDEFDLFSTIQADGVTRAYQKDRPDREKIEEILEQYVCLFDINNQASKAIPERNFGKIIALIEPLIEEAKREERERMNKKGDFLLTQYEKSMGYEVIRQFWQALKEGK